MPVVRGTIALQKLKLAQVMDAGMQRLGARKVPQTFTGMDMFSENRVSSDDPRMARVYEKFERNLRDIVVVAARQPHQRGEVAEADRQFFTFGESVLCRREHQRELAGEVDNLAPRLEQRGGFVDLLERQLDLGIGFERGQLRQLGRLIGPG